MTTTTKSLRINLLRAEERKKPSKLGAMPSLPKLSIGGSRYVQLATGVLILELVGFGAWMALLYSQAQGHQKQITQLKAQDQALQRQLAELRDAEATKLEIQRRLDIIGRVAKSQGLPVAMMNGVLGAVPQGLWLTDFDVKPQELRRQVDATRPVAYSSETLSKLQEKKQDVGVAPAPGARAVQTKEVTELQGYTVTIKGMAFNNFQVAEFMDNLRQAGVFADVDFTVTQATSVQQVRVMNFEVTASVQL